MPTNAPTTNAADAMQPAPTPANRGPYYVTAAGTRRYFQAIADEIAAQHPEAIGKHIFEQLDALGFSARKEFDASESPHSLPYSFSDYQTPGAEFEPLTIWGNEGEKELPIGPANGGVAVADITTTDGTGRFTEHTAARSVIYARLFVAAPDLLAALIQCLPHLDKVRAMSGGEGDIAAMNARAAIAKATRQN